MSIVSVDFDEERATILELRIDGNLDKLVK